MAITQSEERVRTRHFLTTLERLVQEVQDADLRTWPMAAILEERWRYRRVLKVSKDFELPDDDSYRRVNDDEILFDLTHHGKLEQSFVSSSLPTSRSLKIRFSIPETFGSGDMDSEIDALLNQIKTELVNDLEGIMKQFLVGQIPGGFVGAVIPLSDLDPSDLVKCSLSYRYLEKALSALPTGLIDRTYTSEALLALLDEDILANLTANLHQAPHVVAELWRISSGFDEELLLDHADWIASQLPKVVFKSSIGDAEGYANFEAMVKSLPESIKASLRSQLSKLTDSNLTILIGRDPRDISTGKKATMDIQPGDTITTTALSLQFKNSLIDQLRYALIKGIRLNQLKLRVTTMSPSESKVGEYPLESNSEHELLKKRLKPLKKTLISLGRSESEATDELESFLSKGTLVVTYNASTWTLAC